MTAKDQFEIGMYVVAIVGGLVTAALALMQQRQARHQREKELRWNQAKMGKDLLGEIYDEPETANALDMLDMDPGFVKYPNSADGVSLEAVYVALDPRTTYLDVRGLYIQRCFNFLGQHLHQMEHFIQTELITLTDVSSPSGYYAAVMAKHKALLTGYFASIGYPGAVRFLDRFPAWKDA